MSHDDDVGREAGLPMTGRVDGIITVVQKQRIRVQDARGRGYLFVVAPGAGASAADLEQWAATGTAVSVEYEGAPDHDAVATRIRAQRPAPARPVERPRVAAASAEATPSAGPAGCAAVVDPTRRRFLVRLILAASAGAAALLGLPAGWVFFAPPRDSHGHMWHRVGSLADFAVGRTVKVVYLDAAPLPWAGYAGQSAAWLRRENETEFVAFTIYCTHTGCPVRWEEGAGLFLCPCHGGAFQRDGAVAAGPPPQPLTRYEVRVRDGHVELQPTPLAGQHRS